MAMPINLVLVRHGESEGNLAVSMSKKGDHAAYTAEFRARHNSKWRLTDRGIKQAQVAGEWIRANTGPRFDRYYASEFLRAMETAFYLNLPDASWYCEFYLRERDRGLLDVVSYQDRETKFFEEFQRRERDGFFWTPSGGESMAQVCLRIDRVLDTLHRECSDKNVIIVCHGEIIWAFRIRLERMTQRKYMELDRSKDPCDRIYNGQIIQYARRSPFSSELFPYLGWMRSVCPTDQSLSSNEWVSISRPKFSNEDLLAEVSLTSRLVN